LSNNTNNLFLVIVGAVIIFAIFMIIKTNNDNTVKTLTDRFDSYFRQSVRAKPNYPLTKDNVVFDLEIVDYNRNPARIFVTLTNKGESRFIGAFTYTFHNCDTKRIYNSGFSNLQQNFNTNQVIRMEAFLSQTNHHYSDPHFCVDFNI